jgi:hypothetical protein
MAAELSVRNADNPVDELYHVQLVHVALDQIDLPFDVRPGECERCPGQQDAGWPES